MPSDEELAGRCLRGEPEATRELIARFEGDVFAVSLKMLRHRHDAEDVAQEVFLRVFRSLKTWDATRPLKPCRYRSPPLLHQWKNPPYPSPHDSFSPR